MLYWTLRCPGCVTTILGHPPSVFRVWLARTCCAQCCAAASGLNEAIAHVQDEMDTWQLDGLDGLEQAIGFRAGHDASLPLPDVASAAPQRTTVPVSAFSGMHDAGSMCGGQHPGQQPQDSASPPGPARSQPASAPTSQELPPLPTMRSTSMGHSYARFMPETGEVGRHSARTHPQWHTRRTGWLGRDGGRGRR